MALRHIDTPTMEALTTHWCTTAREHLARPMLKSLLGVFDGLAEEFTHLHETTPEQRADRIARLKFRANELDNIHDGALTRCWAYLEGIAGMYEEESLGVPLLVLQNTLIPFGRESRLRSYQDQGTAAEKAKAALTDDVRAQLIGLNLPGIDLLGMMERWIDAGIELKRVDARRQALMHATDTSADIEGDLRARWLKAVEGLRTLSEFDTDLDDAAKAAIFERLDAETARASAPTAHG